MYPLKGPYPVNTSQNGGPTLSSLRVAPFQGYDVYEDTLYDTVDWPAAGLGAGATLPFFQYNGNDKTVSNVAQNGQLPSPQMFHAQRLFVTPLVTSAVGNAVLTAAGLVADLDTIFLATRSFFTYINPKTTKPRGPMPLCDIGSAGGVIPVYGGNNAPGAGVGAVIQSARLDRTGGYPINLIVFPNEQISFTLTCGVQTALTTAAGIPLRLSLYGWRYIPVG